jgi:hypothetical protein
MNIVIAIPDRLANRLSENGSDLGRQALEALVLENFRAGRITMLEVRDALGFEVLDQVNAFLKARGAYEPYTLEDVDRQVETLAKLGF